MSRNNIIVLLDHRHKLLDIIFFLICLMTFSQLDDLFFMKTSNTDRLIYLWNFNI
jgi:hypothetical protein